MTDEPQAWPTGKVGPQAERWRPIQTFHVELVCPTCQRGRLVANGEVREQGNVHGCTGCPAKWVVPGEPYPRRVERIDVNAQEMRGGVYGQAEI